MSTNTNPLISMTLYRSFVIGNVLYKDMGKVINSLPDTGPIAIPTTTSACLKQGINSTRIDTHIIENQSLGIIQSDELLVFLSTTTKKGKKKLIEAINIAQVSKIPVKVIKI